MRSRGGVAGVVAGTATALLLAACSTGPGDPAELPSRAPALSSTPTASSSNPTPSADPSVEVEAAVRAYFDAVNVAISSGQTASLRDLTDQSCPCWALVNAVEKTYLRGQAVGARWELETVADTGGGNSNRVVSVVYRATPYRVVGIQGETLQRFAGHRNSVLVRVSRTTTAWKVVDFSTVSQEQLS